MRAALGILVVLVACGGVDDRVIDVRFDVCEPIVLDTSGATSAQRGGVADAIALWGARDVGTITIDPVDGARTLPVVFEDANPAFRGYYDDEAGVVYVNARLDDAPEARAIAIAHELGHAFGLFHVDADERASLMNPHNLTIPPTEGDARELERLWGRCAR